MGATKSSITKLENLQHDDIAEAKKVVLVTTTGTAYTAANMADIKAITNARELWFGKKSVQTSTDWADDTLTAYQAISGNGVYGADENDEAKVLGTDDTPIITGQTYFTVSKLLVTAASSVTPYKLRIVYGTGTMADAVSAGQYVETMYQHIAARLGLAEHIDIMMPYVAIGNKVWIQCKNATDDATIDFLVGVKGY